MDGPTNNIQKLADLAAGKETEKGRLDLFSGDVDERDQFLDDYSAQLKASKVAEALGLGVDTGVEGEDEDRFIDTTTNAIIATEIIAYLLFIIVSPFISIKYQVC